MRGMAARRLAEVLEVDPAMAGAIIYLCPVETRAEYVTECVSQMPERAARKMSTLSFALGDRVIIEAAKAGMALRQAA